MRRSLDDTVARLKSRRSDSALTGLQYLTEDFAKRPQGNATQYALGAMQEVNRRSTQISHEEFEKVKTAIKDQLPQRGFNPDIRMQGSVPLNIHIRGVSDVDLLEINAATLTYSTAGPAAGTYYPITSGRTPEGDVINMRNATEDELSKHFYAAKVDRSNAKSIQLSGGAFRRKVDVVPSHWHDSVDYQRTKNEIYRGVTVVNKETWEAIENFPFLFGHRVNEKGLQTADGSKMATRLLKNIKSDEDEDNPLSSYDIASLMYQCPSDFIQCRMGQDLSVLSGADTWLSSLALMKASAMKLDTPDGTRKIIDSEAKWEGLCLLAKSLSELCAAVFRESVSPYYYGQTSAEVIRSTLKQRSIAPVPSY